MKLNAYLLWVSVKDLISWFRRVRACKQTSALGGIIFLFDNRRLSSSHYYVF